MDYVIDDRTYSFNYQDLKDQYNLISSYTNEQFVANLIEILHFVCFVSYVKNTPSYILLNDRGLIHEIAHLLHLVDDPTNDLDNVREQFNIWCKLA